MTIRVMLVDDQRLVRSGFAMLVESQPDMHVVAEAADGVEAVDVLRRTPADVVLMDVRMPRLDGVEATRRIVGGGPRRSPDHRADDVRSGRVRVRRAAGRRVRVPAQGRAPRGAVARDPHGPRRRRGRGAEHHPAAHRSLRAPRHRRRSSRRPASRSLTEREREVWLAIARGLTNGEIAESLGISEATVKTHVGNVLGKTGMRDRVALVVLAYECGVVGSD